MTGSAWLTWVTQFLDSQPSYSICPGMEGIILPPFFQQMAYQIITSALSGSLNIKRQYSLLLLKSLVVISILI